MKATWNQVRRASPLVRKGVALFKQVPRFSSRMLGRRQGTPPVIANSFPKSGTHLLVQVLEALPGVVDYESFIASIPPIRFAERSDGVIHRRIGLIAPGELVSAHLHFRPSFADRLSGLGCVHFLIYRDLRDVAISEAHYLTRMNRWHRAHKYFSSLPDDDARILTALRGIPPGEADYHYPNIAERFAPFEAWLERPEVCGIRFEDLAGSNQQETLRKIAEFYGARVVENGLDIEALARRMAANIDPARSRTFRSGKIGAWRSTFGDEHRAAAQEVAGDLLTRLGYGP